MLKKTIASMCIGYLILYTSISTGFSYNTQVKSVVNNSAWDSNNIAYKLNTLAEHRYYLDEVEKKMIENLGGLEIHTRADSDKVDIQVLDEKYFLDYELNMKMFTLKDIGKHVEVWVAKDLSYSVGDLRNSDSISDEQVNRMKIHFEEIIYPSSTEKKSIKFHNGENSWLIKEGWLPEGYYTTNEDESRLIILVDNIKDEQYYNQDQSIFIPGYHWNLLGKYMDRDIIIINSRDWDKLLDSMYLPTLAEAVSKLLEDNQESQ